MSTTRLTFLYPHLFKSFRLSESAATHTAAKARCRRHSSSAASSHRRPHAAPFSTSARAKEAVFERHGKAVEPQPGLPRVVKLPQPGKQQQAQEGQTDAAAEKIGSEMKAEATELEQAAARKGDDAASSPPPPSSPSPSPSSPSSAGSGTLSTARPTPQQKAAEATMESSGPMEAVLHMPPPGHTAHRHIPKPPYVHHFDTYTLVKQLEAGGYDKAHAITIMKAVRSLLARNLDVAQDGLVSKSDVENETYLFQAACSELSAEVSNNRKAGDEVARQQRTLLQHEVDILSQKLTQDLMTLRDDVKGMFNDRKMVVREEQRRMEGAVSNVIPRPRRLSLTSECNRSNRSTSTLASS